MAGYFVSIWKNRYLFMKNKSLSTILLRQIILSLLIARRHVSLRQRELYCGNEEDKSHEHFRVHMFAVF